MYNTDLEPNPILFCDYWIKWTEVFNYNTHKMYTFFNEYFLFSLLLYMEHSVETAPKSGTLTISKTKFMNNT